MLCKYDNYLAGFVICLNFFMMGITESSLYTILPKYLGNNSYNSTDSNHLYIYHNTTHFCHLQKPPYFIVGMVFLSRNLVQLIANSIIGVLVDHMNNYFILIISQIFGIVISLIYAFSNSVEIYIVGRCIDAFVNGSMFITVLSIISTLFTNVNVRGRYFGMGNTLYFIGHSVGPVYGAEIDEKLGKPAVFFLLIPLWCLTILSSILLYLRVRKNLKKKQTYNEKSSKVEDTISNSVNLIDNSNQDSNDVLLKSDSFNNDNNNNNLKLTSKYDINKCSFCCNAIFEMLKNVFVLACLFQIFIVNLSMFAIPATLPSWMGFRLCSSEVEQGLVWTFGFVGYLCGVGLIVLIVKYAQQIRLFAPVFTQILVGILLILLPFSRDWRLIFIPIIGMYFSVGVVEQVIFPLTTFLADSQFNSDYGSMSSLTSQFLTISGVIGTLSSGPITERFGFRSLCIILGILNLLCCPITLIHRKLNMRSENVETSKRN